MPHDHDLGGHPAAPALPRHGRLAYALQALLVERGHLAAGHLQTVRETIAARSPARGARVVAEAWASPAFRQALRDDPRAAVASLGIDPGPSALMMLENTEALHNVVVCTLCSCYPRALLGPPPDWYKAVPYRARVVRAPREVLAEFGTHIDPGTEVRVHDSTADLRYLVLPLRPAGTAGWTAERLATLVTRDSMIGVTPARAPVAGEASPDDAR